MATQPVMQAYADPQPTDVNAPGPNVDDRINQIWQSIQEASKTGNYGTKGITVANEAFKSLRDEMNAGKLSQKDYVQIGQDLVPKIQQFIMGIGGLGSNAANAQRAAGGETFTTDYGRDLDIYKTAQEVLGRDLTQNELYQLRPVFAGPNGPDSGKAYLAKWAEQDAKSPENLAKKAPDQSGHVNEIFQQLLSRGASKDEVDYFGRMLASGEVTPYEVNQFVQQLPEYKTNQDKAFRSGLEQELSGYDDKAFNREKENILSRYTQAGIQNSSALDFAMTDALSKLAENRGGYLAQLSASQYGGNKDAARQDYQTSLSRLFDNQDYSRGRANQGLDYLTQRADQGVDYQRQRDDYLSYLNSQPKRQGNGLLGSSLAGAGALAPLGGYGALAGGALGAFGYLNG